MKRKLHEVNTYLKTNGYKTRIFVTVHDEIGTMHPKERRELEVIPIIQQILQDLPFRVPMTWGADYAITSWGDKKAFKSVEALCEEVGV